MARLVVSTEQHFLRAPSGEIYVVGSEDHAFFARYLDVFDEVVVLSRARAVSEIPSRARRVDGPGVRFSAVPDFQGALGTLAGAGRAIAAIERAVADERDALFMLRPPGAVSVLVWATLARRGAPYAVELVTDPAESFRREAYGSPLVARLRRPLVAIFRAMCRRALAVSYVTEQHLQRRYPARDRSRQFFCPDGDLRPSIFERHPAVLHRIEASPPSIGTPTLFLTGRMDRPFKGVDVALEALARLRARGVEARLEVAGGGRLLARYRDLARSLGVDDAVTWLDEIGDPEVLFDRIAAADLFILPTRREGLPRALLEAMGMGMPCIATPVAGIPELLDREELVPVDDPEALARSIEALARDRAWRLRASRRNHARARAFSAHDLASRRRAFHRNVAELFEGER